MHRGSKVQIDKKYDVHDSISGLPKEEYESINIVEGRLFNASKKVKLY